MAVHLQPLADGPAIQVDKQVLFIGRDSDCDVVLKGSRRVSRKHCCLAHVNDRLVVRDLGSMNGIWINGKRIERTGALKLGDELAIGDIRFQIVEGMAEADLDLSQDIPVVVASADGEWYPTDDSEVIVAEPVMAEPRSAIPPLADIDSEEESGDVISLDDDDSNFLPLIG